MKQRGRKSNNAVATVRTLEVVPRPAPPERLNRDARSEWRAVVNSMPADWFGRETWALLEQYCRHVAAARRWDDLLEQAVAEPELDLAKVRDLAAMQAKETQAIKTLASAMRLSQQASYSARGAAGQKERNVTGRKPWEISG